jgi:Asp-tRNA(Asn)/Glu-tRNA(Gln) amidotransferase A subunit family amidase
MPDPIRRRSYGEPIWGSELTALTIAELAAALASRQVSAREVLDAYLERIGSYEPSYNAFVTMNFRAQEEAAAIDLARAEGRTLGPLAGVPIAVKDTIDVAGLPTTGGWAGFLEAAGGIDLIPEHDAVVVRRLRAAGGLILGKTNLPIFAGSGWNANDSVDGPTYNALDRRWSPGGSSTGTATAVAAGFAAGGLGAETGGSIQNPAAAQSLVGVKPTFGLVSNEGAMPQAASTRDVIGPITTTVRDAAILLDVLAEPGWTAGEAAAQRDQTGTVGGYSSALTTSALRGARIGLYGAGWRRGGTEALAPATATLYERAIRRLEARGVMVVSDPFDGSGFADLAEIVDGYDLRGYEDLPYELDRYLRNLGQSATVHSMAEYERTTGRSLFGEHGPIRNWPRRLPSLAQNLRRPSAPPDLSDFLRLKRRYLEIFGRVMARHGLAALVFPQHTEPIGPIDGGRVDGTTVSEINIAGLPAVVVPDGEYSSGKPFSLIFVGMPHTERSLLALAYDYEQAYPGRLVNTRLDSSARASLAE